MVLVTRRDAEKIQFNLERREQNSVADYMRVYLNILQLAFEYNFITSEERDKIATAILMAVKEAAKGNEIVISNYVYIIGIRLSQLNNYECWELMRKITNQEEANKFIAETKEYFLKRVKADLSEIKKGFNNALKLKNKFIINGWKNCHKVFKQIQGCLEEGYNEFELKTKHSENSAALEYTNIQFESGCSYLERIENYLYNFKIETSILIKLDAGKILKGILEERSNYNVLENNDEIEQAQEEYNLAVEELKQLEEYYSIALNKASEVDAIFNEKYEKFQEEHPELDEYSEEFEDLFDEYWMSCPEYMKQDSFELEEEYHIKREKMQAKVISCKNNLDALKDKKVNDEIAMSQKAEEVITLLDVLNEYAIVALARNGQIIYPSKFIEKRAMIANLDISTVTKLFLQNEAEKIGLSAEERNYLEN